MTLLIRRARPDDATALSTLIRHTLTISNLDDYGQENIDRVAANFTPELLVRYFANRFSLVAEKEGRLVGTASHEDGRAKSVFVSPAYQGTGAGRALMTDIMNRSVERGEPHLDVRSSLFAERFYQTLGFVALGDIWDGSERTIHMRRQNQ